MSNQLSLEALDDFVELTLNKIQKDAWIDLSQTLQEYTFFSRWFQSNKKPEKGGVKLEWKLRTGNQGTAKHTAPYAVDSTNRVNVMTKAKQGWSFQTVNYIYDTREEAFQSGPERIIDEMKTNEQGLMNDFAALMETAMWTAPSSSTLDPMPPAGIPYWIQTCTTLGWNGGDPSGWAAGAGEVLTATVPTWKNYGGPYKQVSRDDLVEKVVNAMDFCVFKPPMKYPEIGGGEPDWGCYTVHSVLATMRRMLQAGNDSLGPDVARWSDRVVIRGVPVIWVPALTNSDSDAYDSTNPFYGINWKKFEYFFKTGENMVKHPPQKAANQHRVRERHMDNAGNFCCYDRRSQFKFHVA